MTNEIMTLEEVASYLRVSERTITDWVQNGELPGGKLGTSWRFKRSDIENWVNRKLTPRIKNWAAGEYSLSALLSPERTAILNCTTKDEALNQMVDLCLNIPGVINRQVLSEAIFKREQLMSTGIGLGIAIPHARLNTVNDIYMAMGINTKELTDYDSLDGLPVRIIVLLIAGRDQHTEYVKTLSRVAALLKDKSIRDELLKQTTAEDVYREMIEKDSEQ